MHHLRRFCMHVSRKIALTVVCGFVVMHASQLGWNSSIKLPRHSPVIQVGGAPASSVAKFEHRTAPHHHQRREATREMSSVRMTDELAARQVSAITWSFNIGTYKVIACRYSGCRLSGYWLPVCGGLCWWYSSRTLAETAWQDK